MKLYSIIVVLVCLTVSLADHPQAPEPDQAPAKPYCLCWLDGECFCGICNCPGGYKVAYNRSLKSGKPLIIWVDVRGCMIKDCINVRVDKLQGYVAPCCVVAEPGDGGIYLKQRLPASASQADIQSVLKPAVRMAPIYQPMFKPIFAPAMRGGGSC